MHLQIFKTKILFIFKILSILIILQNFTLDILISVYFNIMVAL